MTTHGSSSEDDGDDEDSSSDEEVESMMAEYVKKDIQVCEESQHVRLQRPLERRASSSTHQVHKD
jgi:hypothetical protein